MDVLRVSAFSHEGRGGNPAGVAFCEEMPADEEMLRVAKDVGYSETAFLVRQADGWRVRYFAGMPPSRWTSSLSPPTSYGLSQKCSSIRVMPSLPGA